MSILRLWYGKYILLLITIMALSFINLKAYPMEDEADRLYQKAYKLVLDKKWSQAKDILQQVIDQYPKSSWVDDARFWQCYTLEKLEPSLEGSFKCYESFIKKYSSGKWVDDAKNNMIRLARELAKSGKPEYQAYVKEMEEDADNEIAMAALFALRGRNDERSLTVLMDLYDKTSDLKMRKKMVYILGTFEAPEAGEKLLEIARNDQEAELRSEAIFWLGQQHDSKEVLEFLKDRALNDTDEKVQKKAIFSIAQGEDERALDLLIDIAKTHKSKEIREDAVFWIGQHDASDRAARVLEEIALNDPDEDIREKAVFSLAQIDSEKSMPILLNMAKSSADPKLREYAIFWITQSSQSPEVIGFLVDLVYDDPDTKIQKKALFALTQIEESFGEKELLDIARKHKNSELRQEALFWLGQQATTESSIAAIKDFALNDSDPQIQEKALFALTQLDNNQGVPHLIEIAENHSNLKIRKKAIFWLGQSDDERAVKALEEFLYSNK